MGHTASADLHSFLKAVEAKQESAASAADASPVTIDDAEVHIPHRPPRSPCGLVWSMTWNSSTGSSWNLSTSSSASSVKSSWPCSVCSCSSLMGSASSRNHSLHQLGAIQTTTRHGQTCPATRLKPKHRGRKRAINAEVHWARVGSLITFLAKQAAASRRIPASSDRMTDLCNGCAIEVVFRVPTYNCTYGMSCPCSRELVARLTTACVSSPRAWAASIFSHMLQGLGMSMAPPHPGALCSPASDRSPLKPGSKNRR